ncbi:YbbR-like domain-containing protein [Verrucomicrobiota bacterium]
MANKFKWLEKALMNNWALKLLALLLASITYYAVTSTTSNEIKLEVPLEVKLEKKIAIHSQDPKTVRVTFRGSEYDLQRLDLKQVKAVVKSSANNPDGSEKITITPRNIEGAPGITKKKIRPETVTLTFDREVAKNFDVSEPRIINTPLIGKAKVNSYEPHFVLIHGSKRRLYDENKPVTTEPVDVDGRVESFTKRVRVLPPTDTGVSRIEPPEITVHVNIATESVSRDLTNVLVQTVMKSGTAPDIALLNPETVKVTLQGRPEVLDGIKENAILIFVDCSEINEPGSYDLPVQVHLPSGTDVNSLVEPKSINVIFKQP